MYKLTLFFISLLFCLSGCTAPTTLVRPVNDGELSGMTKNFRPELTRQGILDAQGHYYSPRISVSGLWKSYGNTLYSRLSPSFRYPGLDASQYPATFEAFALPEAKVSRDKTGFTLQQGLETVRCEVIAATDWNHDDSEDWIVLCRVTQQALPINSPLKQFRNGYDPQKKASTPTKLSPRGEREYFLVIINPDAPVLKASVIGIRDKAGTQVALFHSPEDALKYGLIQEDPAVDMLQGQQEVVKAPEKIAAPRKKGAVEEKKLLE